MKLIILTLVCGLFSQAWAGIKAPLPQDYLLYSRANALLSSKTPSVDSILQIQRELLTYPLRSESDTLESEFKDLTYALELRRFRVLAKQNKIKPALEALGRSLSNLPRKKWPLLFTLEDSSKLAKVCTLKKEKIEECQVWISKIVSVFPRGAHEMEPLIAMGDQLLTSEGSISVGSLFTSYQEKKDLDTEAVSEMVKQFVDRSYSDVIELGQKFLETYPRSNHMYRVRFLIGESYWRKNKVSDAKKIFEELVRDSPWSWYGLMAATRTQTDIVGILDPEPMVINEDNLGLTNSEKRALDRIRALSSNKKNTETSFEFRSFDRISYYSDEALVYLARMATDLEQYLSAFRFVSELFNRGSKNVRRAELGNIIFPVAYDKLIQEQAQQAGIEWILALSLTKQESAFNTKAISGSGALGLMQLMPFTALEVNANLVLERSLEPEVNIPMGVQYLSQMLKRYDQNWAYALAAYNAGPTKVSRWKQDLPEKAGIHEFIESIPYKETRDYVTSILRNVFWYKKKLSKETFAPESVWK